MIGSAVYSVLYVMYVACGIITMRYFLSLLQWTSWEPLEYFHILSRENLRWLPLIFCLVPMAALYMSYGLTAAGIAGLYLLVLSLFYWPWRGRSESQKTGKKKRLFAIGTGFWILCGGVCLITSVFQRRTGVFVLSLELAMQPLLVPLLVLLDGPIEHRMGRHYIRGSEDILRLHRGMQIIMVTGSTACDVFMESLCEILRARYSCEIASRTVVTTMDAAQVIRDIKNPSLEYFICRIDAGSTEDMREIIHKFHPAVVIQASVDYYSLLDDANPAEEGAIHFMNGDDSILCQYVTSENVKKYGFSRDCDGKGAILSITQEGTTFSVSIEEKDLTYTTKLIGRENITALVGAIYVAYSLCIPENAIIKQVEKIQTKPHRLELMERGDFVLIDDSANEQALQAEDALETLCEFQGTKILITNGFSGLGAIQEEANRRYGKRAAEVCDYIVLTEMDTAYGVRGGILENGFVPARLVEVQNLKEAFSFAESLITPFQKIVLLEYAEQKEASLEEADKKTR